MKLNIHMKEGDVFTEGPSRGDRTVHKPAVHLHNRCFQTAETGGQATDAVVQHLHCVRIVSGEEMCFCHSAALGSLQGAFSLQTFNRKKNQHVTGSDIFKCPGDCFKIRYMPSSIQPFGHLA